jgi:hypothetical protein
MRSVLLENLELSEPMRLYLSKHPVPQIGTRNIPRDLQTGDGEWLDQSRKMASCFAERAPNSCGCGIGTRTVSTGENPLSPKIGRKPLGNLGQGSMPATRTFWKLSVGERAFPSGNGWTLSWRTIPSRPTAHKKHTSRTFARLRSEQQRIERHVLAHLRNVVRVITETGLRVYKELMPGDKGASGPSKLCSLDI